MNNDEILKTLEEIRDIQRKIYGEYVTNANESLAIQRESFALQKIALKNQSEAIEQQQKSVKMQSSYGRLYRIVVLVAAIIVAVLIFRLYDLPF